ncbi:vacuolar amino acid permease [Pseudohyphozyma bogoriensis]|nr:vacuolar amino acid permease [Pseudohyphozyma bogoriensis]
MSEQTPLLSPPRPASKPAEESPGQRLSVREKWIILLGCQTALFFGSLDQTITATLISPIASSFQASHQASWLGTSFLLSNIAFTPLYGRLCDILGRRIANASAIALFTAGTVGCALAPNMKWLIVARRVQRSGARYAVQIPFLLLALLSGLTHITYPVPSFIANQPLKTKLRRIDFLGCGSLLVGFGSVLTALSLTENERLPWSNRWVILAVTLAAVFLSIFIFVEAKISPEPVLPFSVISRRTPFFVCLVTVFMYHYPIFFLSLTSSTTSAAGAHLLPSSVGMLSGSLSAGAFMHRTGKYWTSNLVAGFFPVIITLTVANLTPSSPQLLQWGALFPMGFGFGYILNTTFIAIMAAVPQAQVPAVTGVIWLFRTTGQVSGVAITSAILHPALANRITGKDADKASHFYIKLIREDASIIPKLPEELQAAARASYAVALKWTFLFCAAFAFFTWLAVIFVEEISLDGRAVQKKVQTEVPREELPPARDGEVAR